MFKRVLSLATAVIATACAQPQPIAPMPSAQDVQNGATVPCPAGMAQYCAEREYRGRLAASRVETARKELVLARDFYTKHPDNEHAVEVTAAEQKYKDALAAQDRLSR